MKEISEQMARYLFHTGREVYRLYEDGTEAMVNEHADIPEHAIDGIFGVEE